MRMIRFTPALLCFLALAFAAAAQQPSADSPPASADVAQPTPDERWNLFWQATSIGQHHGPFNAPYTGPLSLQPISEWRVSLTTTLFLGLRLDGNTVIYIDPEVAGGRGFSNVDGIADAPNGELPRVASATPKPYLARGFIQHDFGFGSERESFDSDENQLAGSRPVVRYTIYAGRFSVTDFFDNNRYSHDPRTQFMTWATMYNGAWDYPADVRGYTWGWVHELHTKNWSWRYASAAEPRVANGSSLDRRVFRDRGDVFETERRWAVNNHAGAVRLLGYDNHADAGTYSEALRLAQQTGATPDVTLTRRPGTLKYGAGISFDQEITSDLGTFVRLGWNDGKTESFAFTAIDRLASGGLSLAGRRWRRPADNVATALTVAGISGVHALYLARGGLDFLIGDGRLNYAPEYLWESYYNARIISGVFAALDFQHVNNPAYNHDRGPLWIESLRIHLEFGHGSTKPTP